jgi:hypothetical protein
MTEQIGNTIPAPTYKGDLDFTLNQEILYSTVGLERRGVTLKAGQGVLPLGTFLKKDTSTNYYITATVASEVVGVLAQSTDTGDSASADVWQANIILGGWLKYDHISRANSGTTLASVVGAKINTTLGYFRF